MRHFRITDRLTKKVVIITAAIALAVGIGVGAAITQYLFSGEEGAPSTFIKPQRVQSR